MALTNKERQRRWFKKHKEEKLKMQREIYRLRKEEGICPVCGSNEVETGYVLCRNCLERTYKNRNDWEKKYGN